MLELLGPRRACLARELTKIHEEWIRGTLAEILGTLESRPEVRGEITLVVDRGTPPPPREDYPELLSEHVSREMSRAGGVSPNEALKTAARQRGISRKEAYRLLVEEKKNRPAG